MFLKLCRQFLVVQVTILVLTLTLTFEIFSVLWKITLTCYFVHAYSPKLFIQCSWNFVDIFSYISCAYKNNSKKGKHIFLRCSNILSCHWMQCTNGSGFTVLHCFVSQTTRSWCRRQMTHHTGSCGSPCPRQTHTRLSLISRQHSTGGCCWWPTQWPVL